MSALHPHLSIDLHFLTIARLANGKSTLAAQTPTMTRYTHTKRYAIVIQFRRAGYRGGRGTYPNVRKTSALLRFGPRSYGSGVPRGHGNGRDDEGRWIHRYCSRRHLPIITDEPATSTWLSTLVCFFCQQTTSTSFTPVFWIWHAAVPLSECVCECACQVATSRRCVFDAPLFHLQMKRNSAQAIYLLTHHHSKVGGKARDCV